MLPLTTIAGHRCACPGEPIRSRADSPVAIGMSHAGDTPPLQKGREVGGAEARLDNVGNVTTSAGSRDDAHDAQDTGGAEGALLVEPPWVRVRRVQLIRREIREVLSPGAVEVLFETAEIVVEGGEELGGRRASDRRLYATVMVTIDLSRSAPHFREPADEATARRVAELMEADPQVQQRLHTLATREVAQLAGTEPESLALVMETGVRVDGTAVLVDLDVMATLAGRRG